MAVLEILLMLSDSVMAISERLLKHSDSVIGVSERLLDFSDNVTTISRFGKHLYFLWKWQYDIQQQQTYTIKCLAYKKEVKIYIYQ